MEHFVAASLGLQIGHDPGVFRRACRNIDGSANCLVPEQFGRSRAIPFRQLLYVAGIGGVPLEDVARTHQEVPALRIRRKSYV